MSNIMTEPNTLDETLTTTSQLVEAKKLPTLILGGGFTGLFTALNLSHQHYQTPTITIDRGSRFIFKPLLYEFLSGEMKTQSICPCYDTLLHKSGIEFIQDTIQSIDLQQRQVQLASGLHYNYGNLVLSLDSVAAHFDVEGAEEYTLPFCTTEDAIALSKQLRNCLQRAIQTPKPQKQAFFYQLLYELKQEQGWAILQISHDLEMVRKHCDRVLCLNRTLRCQGTPEVALSDDSLATVYGADFVRYKHSHTS